MRRLLEILILVEATSTMAGAVLCFLRPELVVGPMISGPLLPQAAALLPLAGAAWAALSILLCAALTLGPGDARALRVVLVPVLIGDVLHVAVLADLLKARGALTPAAAVQVLAVIVLFGYRALIVARPALLLGEPGLPAGGAGTERMLVWVPDLTKVMAPSTRRSHPSAPDRRHRGTLRP